MDLRFWSMACLALIAVAGCGGAPVRDSGAPGAEPGAAARLERIAELEGRIERLETALAGAREQAARAELRRIEAEARLADLTRRYDELSKSYDEAVAEVVRAQAKLRGSVSQADAASNIAEAEIALAGIDENDTQARQARVLLRQAADAFGRENFGGALYLSNQAKQLLSGVGGGSMPLAPYQDEVRFAAPLPLVVASNTNVRGGPAMEHPVLTTLPAGTRVEGYSYRDAWVRVRLEDGSDGWVYQSLVAERDQQPASDTDRD